MNLPPEIHALVLKTLENRVKATQAAVKAVVGQGYANGDKRTFRSPVDDQKLGQIYRTDVDPQWQITDRDTLHAFLRGDPANVETVYDIADPDAAIDVLGEHAPHLLAEVTRVRQDAMDDAVSRAATGEQVPGIERVKPEGSLVVKPDPGAAHVVAAMVAAGVITWDGTPAELSGEVA